MKKRISTGKTISDIDIHASLDQYGQGIDNQSNIVWESSSSNMNNNQHLSDKPTLQPSKFYVEPEVSLQDEWDGLFKGENLLAKFQNSALDGNLGSSRFRSVCWRIFWECLSEDSMQWKKDVEVKRKMYTEIRKKYVINPHQEQEKENVDLEKHHPLSLAEDSIWNKYFQDNELRNLIVQDLDRLSPEIEFFQQEKIKNYLLHILFCYAREHPQVSYKQGMHEILSPLIYVMYENCSNVADTKEDISGEMRTVLDLNYLEHDAYCLFYMIMESIQPWYVDLRPIETPTQADVSNDRSMFQKPDSKPVNAISNKLQRIQGSLLQKYDPELSYHLKKIEITPQVYGIRWVRLLFGREFPINRLLILWDGIFANGMAMELVEYIYIAMLIHLRGVLLQNDFSHCLTYLMKFPADTDTRYILKRAVALKLTKKNVHAQQQQIRHHHQGNTPKHTAHHVHQPHQQPHQHQQQQQQQKRHQYTTSSTKQKPSIHPVKYRLGETEEQRYAHALGSGVQANPTSPKNRTTSKSNFFVQNPDYEDGEENGQFIKSEFSAEAREDGKVSYEKRKTSIPSSISNIRERVESGAHIISRLPNTLRDAMATQKQQQQQHYSNAYMESIIEDHSRLQRQVSDLQSQLDNSQTMATYCLQKMEHYMNLMQERLFATETFSDELTILGLAGLKQVREILKGQDLDDVDFSDIDRHIDVAKQQLNDETKGEQNDNLTVLAHFDHFDNKRTINEPLEKQEIDAIIDTSKMPENKSVSESKSESTSYTDPDNIVECNENIFKPLTSNDIDKEYHQEEYESPELVKKNEMDDLGPNNVGQSSFNEQWSDPLSSFNVDE